jgi:Tfp pilus assembly PilM family ATPase
MAGLSFFKGKTKEVPDGVVSPARAPESAIKSITPTAQYRLGRHLAFTVDETAIQMAAARHLGASVKLLEVEKVYFGPDDPATTDRATVLRDSIDQFVKMHGGRFPTISLTLTGPQTALRTVKLPFLRGTELQAALAFEAKRQIPFPDQDCWIDSRVTESITRGSEKSLKASILAATKIAVEEQLAPFRDLGLPVEHVYHTQDVVGRLLEKLPDYDSNRHYTLIDIHRRSTEISYYHGGELEFYHVSSLGSSFLANRSDPTVFEYFAESLATEVQNSLDYYSGQFASPLSREVYIYGDLSYTTDLISQLTDRFGYNFRQFPIEQLGFARGRELPFEGNLAVCLPAVAAVTNQAGIADLLPAGAKRDRLRRKIDRVGIAAIATVGALLLALAVGVTLSVDSAHHHLAELQMQAEEVRSGEMFITYNHLKRRLAANQAFMDKASEAPSYLGLSLKELSHLVPDSVRLYDLQYLADAPESNLQISGLVATSSTPPELILAEMVENLIGSPFYEDVVVERHVKRHADDRHILDFHLSMRGAI